MADGYDFDAFAQTYASGEGQVLYRRVVADLETPIGTYLKLAQDRSFTFLFESVEGGAVRGRYSIIGLEPDLLWRVHEGRAQINRDARI
ncbi:MAG TPA: anthranilate synthase component I, partial [Pelagibacterium sp.]|nr:anthranilate synthase component I [Pelagibacterium sp.]